MAPYLDTEWLQLEEEMGGRLVLGPSFEKYKEGGKAVGRYIMDHLPPPRDDGLETVNEEVNENVGCRIYKPKNATGPLPVGVFCHGGGFSDGSIDMEDGLCRVIASSYPCIIVSIEYRLSTKVDIKTVFQDAFDGFSWSYQNAARLGGDQSKVFMFGSSCGGTLSIATAHRLIELGRKGQLKGVINMAGGTVCETNVPKHLGYIYKSMDKNAIDVPLIDRDTTRMINVETGLEHLAEDEWMFPLLSRYLADFPPVYLVGCGADPLRDDNSALEHELRSKGVKVKLDMYDGFPHVFWMFPNLKATRNFIGNLLAGIKFILDE